MGKVDKLSVKDAMSMYKTQIKPKLSRELVSCSILMKYFNRRLLIENTIDIYKDLQRNNVVCNSYIYNVLFAGLGRKTQYFGTAMNIYKQIKDNTGYIIHPDEILADNFMFAMMYDNNMLTTNFSEQGVFLIQGIQKLLHEY